jgi:hypothetical protein
MKSSCYSIVLFITLANVIYPQEYYPLKNGNRWFYRISASTYPNPYDPANDDTAYVQVLADTLLVNGRKYFTLSSNDVTGGRYLRVDSNYIYYNNGGTGNTETPYFNLRAAIGDTLRLSNSGPYFYTKLTKIDTLVLFGVKSRVLTFSEEGLVTRIARFSDKFGPITQWSYGDPPAPWPDYSKEIIGCKLYDTTYGYSLSVSSSLLNPVSFILNQNYPNPFNSETTIQYSLSNSSEITLIIRNVLGQIVWFSDSKYLTPGKYAVHWTGKDLNNIPVSSGLYYYTLLTNEGSISRKLVLLK